MKNLIFINGTIGVGKTATGMELHKLLPKAVFLDGDWCWYMSPFVANEETKLLVFDNITYLLNSFLYCSEFENIIFCWMMHDMSIIKNITSRLNLNLCKFHIFTLVCSEDYLIKRNSKNCHDIENATYVLEHALSNRKLYYKMNTKKIDMSKITPEQAAVMIKERLDN